ncbi:MAG TPA: PriCT-2 domain-containing protein [Azonexus sp.]|nr:PriCT-2 domain-containing protein [Azonexus sp.]
MEIMKKPGAIAPIHQHNPSFKHFSEAALHWHQFGFDVIPIVPLLKRPAVKWDAWLEGLSPEKIAAHWAAHPDHEVGFIVGERFLILDADSPASVEALHSLEKEAGIPPLMVVTTKRGEHHYFGREVGTIAKADSFSTSQYPDCIDVKTGRSLVILPTSTGKTVKACWVASAAGLFKVEQDFIDLVFHHNGRQAPRLPAPREPAIGGHEINSKSYGQIAALLKHIDPEEGGYDAWVRIGMAIHAETAGSDDGLDLFDQWSSDGATYPGRHAIEAKWRSFNSNRQDRCNLGTIINRAKQAGHDWIATCPAEEDPFVPCETEVVYLAVPTTKSVTVGTDDTGASNPLNRFSLRGMSEKVARDAVAQTPILGGLAMLGQATVIFAPPNSGKTLITFYGLCEDVRLGKIEALNLYYFNVDDSALGLADKLAIADEYGFHMLSEGYRDFKASALPEVISGMVANNHAKDAILVLDTIKKFTNLMDKTKASQFTTLIRQFVMKGGTVIGMAHTNKKPGSDGKPVYGGTSDLVDDFDCAYTIGAGPSSNANENVVVFENIKRRGSNPTRATYRYSTESGLSYAELLTTVVRLDDQQQGSIAQEKQQASDTAVIEAVQTCINQGVRTKILLTKATAKSAGVSERAALKVIERYTGGDPAAHRWSFAVRERGAKVYTLLDNTAQPASTAT